MRKPSDSFRDSFTGTAHKLTSKSSPSSRFEDEARRCGARRIAGIDEAGRGPLAGPVVAAAVILPVADCIPDLNDSKLLTPAMRDKLFQKLRDCSAAFGIGIIPSETIDEVNIYQATLLAMKRAVADLGPAPDYLLIDGNMRLEMDIPQKSIIKGDRLCFSIAAAGIVAKVTRDSIMMELHEKFPLYGFAKHKGYATASHREAIIKHGPCSVHRTCFSGVKEFIEPPLFRSDH
ncbi:MAG: ribonuclease HII [Desulfomonile tiedjei]|nr:ribonuclease HII [Desulfomonile tiedjei]